MADIFSLSSAPGAGWVAPAHGKTVFSCDSIPFCDYQQTCLSRWHVILVSFPEAFPDFLTLLVVLGVDFLAKLVVLGLELLARRVVLGLELLAQRVLLGA